MDQPARSYENDEIAVDWYPERCIHSARCALGLPAVFLFGGLRRNDRPRRIRLDHGDVVVWGGPSRLAFHGVEALADGSHPLTGRSRINLTFRRAG